MRTHALIEALLGHQVNPLLQGRFEAFHEPHIADHAGWTTKAHKDIHVALRTIFPASQAPEDSSKGHPVLFENRTCLLLDFFDSHIFMLHSFCRWNNAILSPSNK